jgi:hypothetical protein
MVDNSIPKVKFGVGYFSKSQISFVDCGRKEATLCLDAHNPSYTGGNNQED